VARQFYSKLRHNVKINFKNFSKSFYRQKDFAPFFAGKT